MSGASFTKPAIDILLLYSSYLVSKHDFNTTEFCSIVLQPLRFWI
jgi:hypothetical protein